ncbi:unnamed protein product [Acanthoscelides obtectus]|uniref:Uncharacterized protein n=1 Tax=Acanthoscelides obtectus TaxID=200917 RepID=A0A9P0K8J8_ACAOB|nr:unnamed protein product [Acanthoscelides obtectus]CAK1622998.1 hypothetical protein AOBTE_LOCUS1765 [Acanthoscelides obtectus]
MSKNQVVKVTQTVILVCEPYLLYNFGHFSIRIIGASSMPADMRGQRILRMEGLIANAAEFLLHPAESLIMSKETPALLAAEVDACRLECGLNMLVSIPAILRVSLTHRLRICLEAVWYVLFSFDSTPKMSNISSGSSTSLSTISTSCSCDVNMVLRPLAVVGESLGARASPFFERERAEGEVLGPSAVIGETLRSRAIPFPKSGKFESERQPRRGESSDRRREDGNAERAGDGERDECERLPAER